jgi:hypothetical protein
VDFPGLTAEIGLREKNEILRRVASHMQASPGGLKGNLIGGATLTGVIEDYLREELHFDQARAAARTVVDHLRLRNFILCYVGADSYGFVHRTFLEYFCAADFVHQFNVARTLSIDGLIALFDDHCCHDEWREVLRLICGQIDEAFVGRIVERLATRTDLDTQSALAERGIDSKLPELPLAIGCLSETRFPNKLEVAGSMLMRQCISFLEKGGIISNFWFDQVIPASRELGEKWPGKKCVYDFKHPGIDSLSGWVEEPWVSLIAAVDSDREKMVNLSKSSHSYVAASALWFLARTWPDEATRALLAQRAVEDNRPEPRRAALRALARTWPDEATRALLAQRAVQDPNGQARGTACCALGKMHSGFGRILPTRDLDGRGPYLDPLQPISRDHIQKAARRANIRPEDIDTQVASLSAHLGWDVTRGAKASGQE